MLFKVTFPVLSEVQDDDERLRDVYRRMIRVSAYIVFPVMVLLIVLARPLVLVLITEKWANCIIYIQILSLASMWGPIHSLNLNLLMVKGKSNLFLRLEIIKKIIGAAILCITIPLGLLGMCYGQVVSSILFLFVNTYYTGKLINVGFLQQMKDLCPTIFYTITMGVAIWFISSMLPSSYLQIVIGILLGLPLYLVMSKLTKSTEYSYLLDLLRQNVPSKWMMKKVRRTP